MNIELCKVKEYLPIAKIKLHPENPRTITRERLDSLKKSILKKGFYQPILIWKRNGVVLSGNHRLIAVQELVKEGYLFVSPEGKKNVLPVVIEDCSQDVANAILFETNNSYASWIEEKLMSALDKIDEVALEDYGFSPDQLDTMIKKASLDVDDAIKKASKDADDIIPERIEARANEDDVPKEPRKVVVKKGDVWLLGDHKLLCGDATMIDDFKKLLGKKKAQGVFTSPPYNANTHLHYKKFGLGNRGNLYKDKNSKDKKDPKDYIEFIQDVLTNCFSYTEGFIFWNVSYSANDRTSFLKSIVPYLDSLHEVISWEKLRSAPIPHGLTRAFEFIFCFRNKGKKEHLGEPNTTNFNVWKISNVGSQTDDHRACFPVLLPETGINLSTVEGDIVIDPFLGTGTTIIACEKTKRKCYGIEIEPSYCDIAIERWEKFTGRTAMHEETGKSYNDYK